MFNELLELNDKVQDLKREVQDVGDQFSYHKRQANYYHAELQELNDKLKAYETHARLLALRLGINIWEER